MALISQIIIASGEGSQRKDLRHLRNLREINIPAREYISASNNITVESVRALRDFSVLRQFGW